MANVGGKGRAAQGAPALTGGTGWAASRKACWAPDVCHAMQHIVSKAEGTGRKRSCWIRNMDPCVMGNRVRMGGGRETGAAAVAATTGAARN